MPCFQLTDSLHISMELGCFLAGVMISAQSADVKETVEKYMSPLKDFLSVIFFASIGVCSVQQSKYVLLVVYRLRCYALRSINCLVFLMCL